MARVQKRPSTSSDNKEISHPFRDSSSQSYKLGARSCRGCHQRKIRCDRGLPCSNCSRCGITCVYPTKDTDVARKGPTLQNISNRLERLEVLLSRFAESSQLTTASALGSGGSSGVPQPQIQVQSSANANAIGTAIRTPSNQRSCESTWELLLNEERVARYASNSNIDIPPRDEETAKIAQSTGSQTTPSHLQHSTKSHNTLPRQPDTCAPLEMGSDVLDFYPDTQLALQLWNVYVKSVDPVLKILHIPTVQSTVVATILDPSSAQSSTVALTFAIYFAAITALCHDDNAESIELPCEKLEILKRYKICLDRLLIATDLMNRPDMPALQALAIYVTCLRVHEVGRSVWVLNGLAIRLAQSIGLHRDGACFQLSPFETEMRLRLWWHLCVLDSRAPEDQGFQPTVDVMNRDLRLPLNVNDNQIYPGMTRFPVESDGWTEMSFFLIQTESCRLLHPILELQEQNSTGAFLSNTIEKRKIMEEHGQYLSAKYGILSGSGPPNDLSRIAIQHITTAGKKMEFVLQLREEIGMRKQKEGQEDATPDVLKLSFKLACDGLESSYVLLKEDLASRFRWFFNMYTQWYALAYVLRCLCSSSIPGGFETERAWALVEELFPRRMSLHDHSAGMHDDYTYGGIWGCLNQLRYQALSLRQHAQLSVATSEAGMHSASRGGDRTAQLLPDTEIQPAPSTTATAHGISNLPEIGQELIADSNQNIFSSLDMTMPEIPFLPDWNAVINGCLNDDGHEMNTSYFSNNTVDAAQY
ncbi:conserved hypothetical protein [Talaromyces stipitatus ATCC 10500]|uniref:Zn(2)-C6 fungal-type domain-containing protein n=1 Tax=Talaromyces stipitatus (strain ATCC 10500 / CBS 375.48 / QM 6759 / NRRL 1006) TaxID=441959 RepID=B8LUX6_TALSN|nr:uncharacterized protein TSTA_060880 [Talaromyces stipitatus ATCC 10500]EED22597.1 conserved hypothetical protein [Talaromyces stipitatus ATCC 10500]